MAIYARESWKSIPGYEGVYEVSDWGRVKSLTRGNLIHHIKWMKDTPANFKPKILKGHKDVRGYLVVHLKDKVHKVHRLVGIAFMPIDNPKEFEINHFDGDKENNSYENLFWCTNLENVQHAWEYGLMPSRAGEDNGNSRLKVSQVIEIKKLLKAKYSYGSIAPIFKVSKGMIARIAQGKAWVNVQLNNLNNK